MSKRNMHDDYDLNLTDTPKAPATQQPGPIIQTRTGDDELHLTDEEKAAVLDLVAHMHHLDAIDFDNMLTFLMLLHIADIQNSNYLKFCAGVKKRFIEPLLPDLPPRHDHQTRRLEALDNVMSQFKNITYDEYKAAYNRGALPPN